MLFISNNKKIDTVIKKLQPSLKLKVNIERDFDCGLNDVFEKRPDVVFIQNQIAGVTGESVARHIQLLLGGTAPKFIFIHDGDAKAKQKKGLYEYLIDLSQDEEAVAADILRKLILLLGPKWQNTFVTSVLPGGASEAFTPAPEPPLDPDSSLTFEVVPGIEPIVPDSLQPVSPLSLISEPVPGESFDVFPEPAENRPEINYEECSRAEAETTLIASGNRSPSGEILSSSESAFPAISSEVSAVMPETSGPAVTGAPEVPGNAETSKPVVVPSPTKADLRAAPREDSPQPLKAAGTDQNLQVTAAANPAAAEKPHTFPSSFAEKGDISKKTPPFAAKEKLQWDFDGEPRLKKSSWKWHQGVELLLVLCLLLGGGYLLKQKLHPSETVVKEVNLLASAASPGITEQSGPAAPQPLAVLPVFIPIAGLDPAFATKNPGWERYVGDGSEFRLFRENDALRAVQVKADKGLVISDALLKSILMELTGTGEYRVQSREKKLGFLVLNATVNDKAELLIYTKKSAIHAVVVSLK